MEPPGPSEDAPATKGPASPIKRMRMELVNKIPDNPKRLVFESTQQRYEIPLRQDEGQPSSHGRTFASAPQNRDSRCSPSEHTSVPPTSGDHSQRRSHHAQRTVDTVPHNLKKVIFESTQERFEHHIRQDHVLPSSPRHDGHDSDDDFMPFPNTRSSTHIDKSKHVRRTKSRPSRAGCSTDESTEERQRKKRSASRSSTVNVRCNPSDVICTAALLNADQYAAIEANGFGQFLRLKVDAIENKNQLSWLLDCTDPDTMLINIGPGKVLPITPLIISFVLGLPIGGENLKMYSRKEGVTLRQQFIRDLNQHLDEDCDIHISNLQQEILNGNVNPLMKRCFLMILCNRLLLPSSSNLFGSLDIKRTMDHELFSLVDLSQLVFNDLQVAVRSWHNRDRTQLNQNIYGCTIFLILYYLDNIDHPSSPGDWISTPRITFYDNDLIHRLTNADTSITFDGALTFGSQHFKRWETTCYAAADVRGVPLQHPNRSMPQMPQSDIPRLTGLLSQPIDSLTSLCKSRVQGLFAQYDDALSLNTRSIEQSLGNILRAQAKLADQFRPFVRAVSSPQSQIDDIFSQNTLSLQQSLGNISTAQTNLADQFRPILSRLGQSQSRVNDLAGGSSRTFHTHNDFHSREPVHCTPPTVPGHDIYSHGSFVSADTLLRSEFDNQARVPNTLGPSSFYPSQPTGPFGSPIQCLSPEHIPEPVNSHSDVSPSCSTIRQVTASTMNWPILDDIPQFKFVAKRLTKKPSKFYSPFKHGIICRPPPNSESSLRFHAFLCSDVTSLKRKTLMHFGLDSLKGSDIALSFGVGKFIDPLFMDAFVKCIAQDDLDVRPECHGFRIFLSPIVSEILMSESPSYHTTRPQSSQDSIKEAIKRCLPTTDLKMAKLIFLPVLHHHHWSLYCINIGHSRVDVLDPMDYSSTNQLTWDTYHSQMGLQLMQRLSVALALVAPRTFPQFANWRCVPIQVPYQKYIHDSALFTMKYMEFYDGEGHGSLHTTIHPDQSREMRAEMLHYLAFHSANGVVAPPELLQFSIVESHPSPL